MKHTQSNPNPLQQWPEPHSNKVRTLLVVLLAGLILLIGTAFLLWPLLAPPDTPTGRINAIATPTAQPVKTGPGDPQSYYDAVKNYVARQLHLSVPQIRAKLQAGVQLITLAQQQGISASQLRTILLDAEQKGHDVLVQGGYLTQQQSEAGMQDLRSRSLQTLATSIKYDFLDH